MPRLPRFLTRSAPPRLPGGAVGPITAVYEGVAHPVTVKRVASARRFTLRVRAADGRVVLTMPPRAALASAQSFADRNAAWIAARLGALPERIALVPGATVPLCGRDHLIAFDPSALRRARAADGSVPTIAVSPRAADPAAAVLAFLRGEAAGDLAAAVARHAAAVGRPVARITLRDTRSRWGSCSSLGALNFSWRLVMAPPFVLDYLAAHEVAHLVHMDHSDRFWGVLRGLAPSTDEAEAWLKRHGAGLHRYG